MVLSTTAIIGHDIKEKGGRQEMGNMLGNS